VTLPIEPGTVFGRLVTLGFSHKHPKNGEYFYQCRCICEKITLVSGSNLRNGNTKGCGCYRVVFKTDVDRKNRLYRQTYTNLRCRHNKRWTTPMITRAEHRTLVDSPCFYCGFEKSNTVRDKSHIAGEVYSDVEIHINGIDRLDSSLGYTKENCFPACAYCNKAKNDRKVDYFLHWIAEVYHKSVKGTKNDLGDNIN